MKKIIFIAVMLVLGIFSFAQEEINEKQKNSLAMLNYLTATTIEIQKNENSKLFLDQIANQLRENTDSKAITESTDDEIRDLTQTITELKILSDKRKQLQFLYDNEQAQAIKKAVPNPLFLLSAVQSGSIKKTLVSIGMMAIDSVSNYTTAKNQAQLNFLKQGWELDEKEMRRFDGLMDNLFTYKNTIINQYDIPSEYALNKFKVDDYVKYKTSGNLSRRQIFLEENMATYKYYSPFWLELADVYYLLAEKSDNESEKISYYKKVIDCFGQYETVYSKIFLKDYTLAQYIPLFAVAAESVMDFEEYESIINPKLVFLVENTEESDWYLRYFAAQSYIDLCKKSNNKNYLNKAYEIVRTNVNYLIDEQKQLYKEYLAPVPSVDKATNIPFEKKYVKQLKKYRKIEVPPVSESLILNCDLLFALANEINISSTEKEKLQDLLAGMFINPAIANAYDLNKTDISYSSDNLRKILINVLNTDKEKKIDDYISKKLPEYLEYYGITEEEYFNYLIKINESKNFEVIWTKKSKLIIPSIFVSENSNISILIRDSKGNIIEEKDVDYEIKKTKRVKNNNIAEFKSIIAVKTPAIKNFKYKLKNNYIVTVSIETLGKTQDFTFTFTSKTNGLRKISNTFTSKVKDLWKMSVLTFENMWHSLISIKKRFRQ